MLFLGFFDREDAKQLISTLQHWLDKYTHTYGKVPHTRAVIQERVGLASVTWVCYVPHIQTVVVVDSNQLW